MIRSMHSSNNHLARKALRQAKLASAISLSLMCFAPLVVQAQSAHATAPQPLFSQAKQNAQNTNKTKNQKQKKNKKKEQSNKNTHKKATKLSAIVVTGLRTSLMSAQQRRRHADQIIETVSALDIGALPDRTVTDTLSRMSGITVERFAAPGDADHPSAEGSGIQIRGISMVRSELNGGDVFSAAGRILTWAAVPSNLLAGIDVYMNPNASIPAGGIGGTVNLRTRLPFDQKGQVISANISYNEGDLARKPEPTISFLYSNTWHSDSLGKIGFLFDAVDSKLAERTDMIQNQPFLARTNPVYLAGTNFKRVFVPTGSYWRNLYHTRRRIGLDAAIQWSPNSQFQMSSQVLRAGFSDNWLEYAMGFNSQGPTRTGEVISAYPNFGGQGKPVTGTHFTYNDQGVFQTGSFQIAPIYWPGPGPWTTGNMRYQADTRYSQGFSVTTDWNTKFKWNLSNDTVLTGGMQFVKATGRQYDFTVFDATYLPGFHLDITDQTEPEITVNPASFMDNPANYFWSAAMDHKSDDWAMQRGYHLDLKHYFDNGGWAHSVAFGLRTTNMNVIDQYSPYHWVVLTDDWAKLPNGEVANLEDYLPNASMLYTFPNFFRGDIHVPSVIMPKPWMAKNTDVTGAIVRSVEGASGWQPYGPYQISDLDNQKEKTKAAYGMLYFGSPGGRLDGNVGVRIVRTDVDVRGHVRYPLTASSDLPSSITDKFHGQGIATTGGRSYTNVLPSLNLNFHLTRDLQWRFAAAKAMARPKFTNLKGYVTLGFTTTKTSTSTAVVTDSTGTGGNPNLKPMVANQFGSSLDWFFSRSGHLYATVFYKDIKNYISKEAVVQTYDGHDFNVVMPVNNGSAKLRGLQLNYMQWYHFLPGFLSGFGIQTNWTYVHSEGGINSANNAYFKSHVSGVTLPMTGVSQNAFNFIVMYDRGPWSGRLAWNWRSKYLLSTTDAGSHLPVWSGDRGTLDASLFYKFNKHVQLGLRLNNINDSRREVWMGPTTYAPGLVSSSPGVYVDHRLYVRSVFVSDRRAELLLRLKF